MKDMVISARALVNVTPDDIWGKISGKNITVRFDDTDVKMSPQDICLSRYFWMFHERLTTLPLTSSMRLWQGRHPRDVFNECLWPYVDSMGYTGQSDKIFPLLKDIADRNDVLFTALRVHTDRYASSLSILDVIDLYDSKELTEIRDDCIDNQSDREYIQQRFKDAEAAMRSGIKNEDGRVNILSWMSKYGIINTLQARQCLIMRGHVYNQVNDLLDKPAVSNLVTGMKTITEFALWSMDNYVAADAARVTLRSVSHNTSRLGYVAHQLRTMYHGDCGSTHYLKIDIDTDDDIVMIIGKYCNHNGKLTVVDDKLAKSYLGKQIEVRSAALCVHPDKQGVCATCIGAHAESIHPTAGLGVVNNIMLSEPIMQKSLGVKHVIAKMTSAAFTFSGNFKDYFKAQRRNIIFKSLPGVKKLVVGFSATNIKGLVNLLSDPDTSPYDVPLEKISSFKMVKVYMEKSKATDEIVTVGSSVARASLTYEFVEYVIKNPKLVRQEGKFVHIDVTGFPKNPIFTIPVKIESSKDVASQVVAAFERSSGFELGDVNEKYAVKGNLIKIAKFVCPKMGIPLYAVELAIYSYIAKRKEDGSNYYGPTRAWEPGAFHASRSEQFINGPIASRLLFEKQGDTLISPYALANNDSRVPVALDVFLDPKSVVEDYERNQRKSK